MFSLKNISFADCNTYQLLLDIFRTWDYGLDVWSCFVSTVKKKKAPLQNFEHSNWRVIKSSVILNGKTYNNSRPHWMLVDEEAFMKLTSMKFNFFFSFIYLMLVHCICKPSHLLTSFRSAILRLLIQEENYSIFVCLLATQDI